MHKGVARRVCVEEEEHVDGHDRDEVKEKPSLHILPCDLPPTRDPKPRRVVQVLQMKDDHDVNQKEQIDDAIEQEQPVHALRIFDEGDLEGRHDCGHYRCKERDNVPNGYEP